MKKGTKMTAESREKLRISHLGHKRSLESRVKQGKTIAGENHHFWKGDGASYRCQHRWVTRYKGKPTRCEKCGDSAENFGNGIHWANIDHRYRRVLDDYIALCPRCHYEYDVQNSLRGK